MKTIQIDNTADKRVPGMHWRKTGYPYMVRSDGGNLVTLHTDANNLTEARKRARSLARRSGWAEIFRWSEDGTKIKPVLISTYDYCET